MKRDTIPTKPKRACKVQDVIDSIMTARKWFDPQRLENASTLAKKSRKFLTTKQSTIEVVVKDGDVVPSLEVTSRPWWPRDDLRSDANAVLLELRNVRIRQMALSQGLAHFLKTLNDGKQIPKASVDDIDDATDLAALRAHERMMEEHLEGWPSALNLEKLKPLFLLKKGVNGNVLYHRLRCMELMGLWASKPPAKGEEWNVRIGPIAKIFHNEVYAPAVAELQKDSRLQPSRVSYLSENIDA